MARTKKPTNIDNYVKKHLRRASLYWPERAQALRNAKVAPGRWKCQGCGQICKKGEYQLDHRIPVIPLDGKIMREHDRSRIDMNKYVDRLFIPAAEWDILCIVCHSSKTQVENGLREIKKKEKMSKHTEKPAGLIEGLKNFVRFLNTNGVAIPFARDPKTQRSSVSLTLMLVSFAVVIVGLIGKASGFFGGVDLSQAMMLFGLSSGLYFSRKITKDKEAQAVIDKATEEKDE